MKKRAEDPRSDASPIPPPPAVSGDDFSSPRRSMRCRVCGGPGASKETDMLCWVCRRLKISAWKDVEKLSLPE